MYEIILKDEIIIKNLIYEIRTKQVMLDSNLAKLYQSKMKPRKSIKQLKII